MNTVLSPYLAENKSHIKKLCELLLRKYKTVSILGTDVTGTQYSVRKSITNVADTAWVERGFVVRIYSDGSYFEYSFNVLNPDEIEKTAAEISEKLENSKKVKQDIIQYPEICDDHAELSFTGSVEIDPNSMTPGQKIEKLREMLKKGCALSDLIVDMALVFSINHVSKIFVSEKKDLQQSYIWSEAYNIAILRRGEVTKTGFKSCSGLKGLEILSELEKSIEKTVQKAVKLLDAKPMIPGEYEIVCAPGPVGIIAHEAFGHGVEMDMFVKQRAKGAEFIGKQVASPVVTMRDGAASAKHVSSYFFDDEGTLGMDTVVIKDGILQTGISDLLSAHKLGTKPTGNGKRSSFMSKAYARMTNTFFESGKDKLEDMIASVKHGYYIEDSESGMEDPKDWGIQVMFTSAEEIIDGKLTGRLYAPVIMTGFVPDLLKSISMVSEDFHLEGAGACGKGYKEWVKVSDGGPYIKTKARLG